MTEAEIIAAWTQEDARTRDAAFQAVVHRYRERLYAIIIGYVRDHDDADDLLQETFVRAYENRLRFRGESSVYTWLCRIAMNLSISHLRKKKWKEFLRFDRLPTPLASDQPEPDRTTEQNELKGLIQKAVAELPEKQKNVFILRHYDELSFREIAATTGNSEGTVKANFFHAFRKVQSYLEAQYLGKK